jgi:transcriptional regulator with XRE-family HTH domain
MMTRDFADLLRHLRLEAGFSQETLAERAGISAKAVSAYEQGLRANPRRDTIALLVEALQLTGNARAEFEQTASRRLDAVHSSASETRHNLPCQRSSFVGRHNELDDLSRLLEQRRLVTITGSGGIGKTRTALEVVAHLAWPPRDVTDRQ